MSRVPLTRGARHLAHVALVLLARVVAVGLGVAALDPRHHALEGRVVGAVAAVPVAVADVHLVVGVPCSTAFCAPGGQLLPRGVECRSRRRRRRPAAGAGSTRWSARWPTARWRPPARVFSGSGTTSSGSTSLRVPSPVQTGQAPNGELNENERGSSSSMASGWSFGQANRSEKRRSRCGSSSGRSTKSRTTTPPARPRATVSTESVMRCLLDGLADSRSTTASMVCFSCFLSLGGSVSELHRRRRSAHPAVALGLQVRRTGRRTHLCARG